MALPSSACGGSLPAPGTAAALQTRPVGMEMAGGEQRSPPKSCGRSAAGAGATCPLPAVTRPSRRVYAAVCTAMCLQRPGVSIPARRLVRRRRIHSCWWRWEGEGGKLQPDLCSSLWWVRCPLVGTVWVT